MLLELFLGMVVGILLSRVGLPSVFPLLIWFSLVENSSLAWFLVGFVSACIIHLSFTHPSFSREHIFIGFLSACIIFPFYVFLIPKNFLDTFIFPLLLLACAGWFFSTLSFRPRDVVGGLFLCAAGFWLLHERAIPAALPAFFLGWWGLAWVDFPSSTQTASHPLRDACLGCFSAILPGLGPGLMNAIWLSGRSSPAMGVSNLIFSIGLLSSHGSVRSAIAAELSSLSSIPWFVLLAAVGWCLSSAYFLYTYSPSSLPSFPRWEWVVIHLAGIFWVGGLISVCAVLASYSLRRLFQLGHFSLDYGTFILIPSILYFYAPL